MDISNIQLGSNTQKCFYTIKNVSDITSLGKTTIYEAIKNGNLAAKKVGVRTLITHDSLQQWISSFSNFNEKGGN